MAFFANITLTETQYHSDALQKHYLCSKQLPTPYCITTAPRTSKIGHVTCRATCEFQDGGCQTGAYRQNFEREEDGDAIGYHNLFYHARHGFDTANIARHRATPVTQNGEL